jgi:hypothetical protein
MHGKVRCLVNNSDPLPSPANSLIPQQLHFSSGFPHSSNTSVNRKHVDDAFSLPVRLHIVMVSSQKSLCHESEALLYREVMLGLSL